MFKLTLNKTLPDTLSACILVALEDLAKAEANPLFIIDMSEWFTPASDFTGTPCMVCLAGAVMADGGMQASPWMSPSAFEPVTARKLIALDTVRSGSLDSALSQFHGMPVNEYAHLDDVGVPDYGKHPEGFKLALLNVAAYLAREGL